MHRHGLVALATYEFFVLFGGFAAVAVGKLLADSASFSGLFTGVRGNGSSYASLGRMQLLGVTLASAIYYVIAVVQSPAAIPNPPGALVASLAISQSLYIAGKALAAWSTHAKF